MHAFTATAILRPQDHGRRLRLVDRITGHLRDEGAMKLLPVLIVACGISQAAFAEGLECRQVADPTPHLSCVDKPATAEVPDLQRATTPSPAAPSRRDAGSDRGGDGVTSRTTRICRNC
jgi:hypothetical protein